ncbi:S-layer homology domain-containing protein [Paenibacillus sp. P25]|nr:S-layer homology domain-containing protein [Paenibacillus sp. P25]
MLSRINRHRISLALVFTLLLGTLMPIMAFGASAVQFKDTADSYAQQEIQALADAGILSGYEDNSFQPRKAMTRAELAKIIVLALGLKENPDKAASFQDVGANSWYRGYVGALVASGITQGTSATAFSPENKVTREELVVFFLRAFGLEETAKKLPADAKLADLSEVSDWAKPHVSLAFNMGFVNGIDSNGVLKFEPKASAERQALARLAYEFKVNKEKYIEKAKALEAAAATGGAATTPGTSGTGSTGTGTGSGATGGGGGGGSAVSSSDDDAQRFTVDSVQSLDPQTVQVTFTTSIRRVSDVRTFSFDGGLTVISADPKQGKATRF